MLDGNAAKCLLEPSATVLPPKLEGVPDNPLDQLEWLLNLGLSQRSEVHHPHIHLRTPRVMRCKHTHRWQSVTVKPGDHIQELLPLERGRAAERKLKGYISKERAFIGRAGSESAWWQANSGCHRNTCLKDHQNNHLQMWIVSLILNSGDEASPL